MIVKPVKMKIKMLYELEPGEIFTMEGRRFIALESNPDMKLYTAVTLDAVTYVQSAVGKNTSIEDRLFLATHDIRRDMTRSGSIDACFTLCEYNIKDNLQYIYPHVKEATLIQTYNYMQKGDYKYFDEFCNVRIGNEIQDAANKESKKLAVRMFCGMRRNIPVYVKERCVENV